jgi:hypothetical protein
MSTLYPKGEPMKSPRKQELVNHPPHYVQGKFEVIDVIEDWKLDFHLGNAVKYIARAEYKKDLLGDLQKAQWYLDRKIQLIQSLYEK